MYNSAKVVEDCKPSSSHDDLEKLLILSGAGATCMGSMGCRAAINTESRGLQTVNSRLGFTTLSDGLPPTLVLNAASNGVCGFNAIECFKDVTIFSIAKIEGGTHNVQPMRARNWYHQVSLDSHLTRTESP